VRVGALEVRDEVPLVLAAVPVRVVVQLSEDCADSGFRRARVSLDVRMRVEIALALERRLVPPLLRLPYRKSRPSASKSLKKPRAAIPPAARSFTRVASSSRDGVTKKNFVYPCWRRGDCRR
jgi:hypothetical protein